MSLSTIADASEFLTFYWDNPDDLEYTSYYTYPLSGYALEQDGTVYGPKDGYYIGNFQHSDTSNTDPIYAVTANDGNGTVRLYSKSAFTFSWGASVRATSGTRSASASSHTIGGVSYSFYFKQETANRNFFEASGKTTTCSGTNTSVQDEIAVILLYGYTVLPTIKYLMTDFNRKVYTVVEDVVTEVPELEGMELSSAEIFLTYGCDDAPTSDQVLSLTKPMIYRWVEETEKKVSDLYASVTALPKPKTIEGVADLSDASIHGITQITAVYSGDVTAEYSYDGETYTELSMEDFLTLDVEELYEGAVDKKIYFRFTLSSAEDSLTNLVVSYDNS